MRLERFERKEDTLKAAAQALTTALEGKGPVLVLSSGASALQILEYANASSLGQNAALSVVDERYTDDPDVSNFSGMYATAFAKTALQAGAEFIDTRVQPGETLEGLARRFEAGLKQWVSEHPDGRIIATLGMGADGHTAGIMPYPENKVLFKRMFEEVKEWAIGYDVGSKSDHPMRVTVTMPFLRERIGQAIIFISGDNKRDALHRVLAGTGSLAETPARIWNDMRKVEIFTDIKE